MHFNKASIEALDRVKRLNIINSITGIKPANLIGSISNSGNPNVAIFSSVIHLGSFPALLGFILRPAGEVLRHTYENIMENGHYTINHIHEDFTEKAHYTSAKFDRERSEFEACELTEEYLFDFKAPFVKESKIKMGMKFLESIPIHVNNTSLIIGEIQHLIIPDEVMAPNGYIELGVANDVGIAGLNSYYALEKIAQYPYARPEELPDFQS